MTLSKCTTVNTIYTLRAVLLVDRFLFCFDVKLLCDGCSVPMCQRTFAQCASSCLLTKLVNFEGKDSAFSENKPRSALTIGSEDPEVYLTVVFRHLVYLLLSCHSFDGFLAA